MPLVIVINIEPMLQFIMVHVYFFRLCE